jgi:hypothetical protein
LLLLRHPWKRGRDAFLFFYPQNHNVYNSKITLEMKYQKSKLNFGSPLACVAEGRLHNAYKSVADSLSCDFSFRSVLPESRCLLEWRRRTVKRDSLSYVFSFKQTYSSFRKYCTTKILFFFFVNLKFNRCLLKTKIKFLSTEWVESVGMSPIPDIY